MATLHRSTARASVFRWAGRCGLLCALVLAAWLANEAANSRDRVATRRALVEANPNLAGAFHNLDKLTKRLLVDSLLSALPTSVGKPSFDEVLDNCDRLEARASRFEWTAWLPALVYNRWMPVDRKAAARINEADVLLRLHATARIATEVSRTAVLQHIEVRNQLASFCESPNLAERLEPVCSDVRGIALIGGWHQAFFGHPLSHEERPYVDRPTKVAHLGRLVVGRVKVCNFAPYSLDYSVASMAQPGVLETGGRTALSPGSCHESVRESIGVEPAFGIAAESHESESTVVRFVSRHANARESSVIRWLGLDLNACVGQSTAFTESAQKACPAGEKSLGFVSGVRAGESEWRFNLVHPDTRLDLGSLEGETALLDETRRLSASVQRQVGFDAEWGNRVVPYHLGPEIEDTNGVFGIGVHLRRGATQTIFGDENLLQEDDLLVALQGRPVFGYRDLALTVIEHASSSTGGAEVPMTAVVLRQGHLIEVPAGFTFNTDYWGRDHALAAGLFGGFDPVLFSATPEVVCAAPVVLAGVAKGLGWLADRLCSASGSSSCSSRPRAADPPRHDFKLCVWKFRQHRALARQTQDGAFMGASFVGLVVPSPLKLIAWAPVNKVTSRAIGPGWLATGLSNAAIEFPETWIQEMRAAAPTANLTTRAANANRAAVFASAIGLVVGGALSR